MDSAITQQIQDAQDHGREKYGGNSTSCTHDDATPTLRWHSYIDDHNKRAFHATSMDRRAHLIKVAGLAVSAIEAFDRSLERPEPPSEELSLQEILRKNVEEWDKESFRAEDLAFIMRVEEIIKKKKIAVTRDEP